MISRSGSGSAFKQHLREDYSPLRPKLGVYPAYNSQDERFLCRLGAVYWHFAALAILEGKSKEALESYEKAAGFFEKVDVRFSDRQYVSMLEEWLDCAESQHDKEMSDKARKLLALVPEKVRHSKRG